MSEEQQPRRRRRRSSGGMAFSGGGLSASSSAEGAELDSDLQEEASDDLNDSVERRAQIEASQGEPEDAILSDERTNAEEEFTPENRMREVGQRDSKYQKEYRLQLLHRMLLRKVPLDKIAQELNLSVSQVRRDRVTLYERLREEAKRLNVHELIGDSIGFYNEIMAMALRSASASKTPTNIKLAAMRTSLSARNDMHRFFQASGVYDVLRYKAAEEGGENEDIGKMMKLTKAILGMDEDADMDDVKGMLDVASELGEDDEDMMDDNFKVL